MIPPRMLLSVLLIVPGVLFFLDTNGISSVVEALVIAPPAFRTKLRARGSKRQTSSPSCRRPSSAWLMAAAAEEAPSSSTATTPVKNDNSENAAAVGASRTSATLRSVTFGNLPSQDQEPELLGDFVLEIGACSTSIVDADAGTEQEVPLFREPADRVDAHNDDDNWAVGAQAPPSLWNRCNLTAHFPASVDLTATVELVQATLGDTIPALKERDNIRVDQVPNRDWVVHVQQGWKPIVVGPDKYVLRFPWHSDEDVADVVRQTRDDSSSTSNENCNNKLVQLQLQGGIAFGTGEHPTTQLCLEWLHDVVSQRLRALLPQESDSDNNDTKSSMPSSPPSLTVLDYGSGSGVLGMAACALSPKTVTAVGIDIDVDACRIANANAEINALPMRSYLPPLVTTTETATNDDESKSLLLKAHHAHATQQRSEGGGSSTEQDLILPDDLNNAQYDVCVANILAGPLVALAPVLAARVRPKGALGLSGILAPQGDRVVEAYRAAGFENVQIAQERDGWVLVTGQRSSGAGAAADGG